MPTSARLRILARQVALRLILLVVESTVLHLKPGNIPFLWQSAISFGEYANSLFSGRAELPAMAVLGKAV